MSRVERHVIGPASDLPPGEKQVVELGGRSIGIFNVAGRFYALANRCPHAGGPLCQGDVTGTSVEGDGPYELRWVRDGEILRCPWHAWEFEIATGKTVSRPELRVRTYRVDLEDGMVVVEV